MDIWKIKSTLKTASNVLDALTSESGPLTPENALKIIFDRRFSTLDGFKSSWDYLERSSFEDFPALQRGKLVPVYSNGTKLCLHLYEQPSPKGLFLCVHGIGGLSEDSSSCIHDFLFRQGYDVAALDLTSSGRSDGVGVKGLSQSALDVAAAMNFIHSSSLQKLPLFLFGHSWGAYGISSSLRFDQSPLAIFELSGFADPLAIMTSLPSHYVGFDLSFTAPSLKKAMEERDPEYAFLSAKEALEKAKNVYCVLVHGDLDKVVLSKASLFHADYSRNGVEKIAMEGRGHGDVMMSSYSVDYLNQAKEANALIYQKYKRNPEKISPEDLRAYQSCFDKRLASMLDQKLFERIVAVADSFARKALR